MTAQAETRPDLEYRFNMRPGPTRCAGCGEEFEARVGMAPVIASTGEPVCGRGGCEPDRELVGPPPCDTRFRFQELSAETMAALKAADERLDIAERFRQVSLMDGIAEDDCRCLQMAAIDLQYCTAEGTRVESWEPLIVRTCGEAAAELLLSGCGEIA